MELEEMKREWERMSERLRQTELLNRRLIREMLVRQGKGALERVRDRMANWMAVMIVAEAVLLCLLVAWCLHGTPGRNFYPVVAVAAASMFYGTYTIRFCIAYRKLLGRIDFTGSIASQLETIDRFRAGWTKLMRTGWFFFAFIAGLLLLNGILLHDPVRIVWTLLMLPVCLLLARWDDVRFRKYARSVRESLEKLRGLEKNDR